MAKILFFGSLSDVSGPLDVDLPENVSTLDDLRKWLAARDETLADKLNCIGVFASVNQDVVQGHAEINNQDEIAFMSALSGG